MGVLTVLDNMVTSRQDLHYFQLKIWILDLQYQARGCGHGKVKQTTVKASAWGPLPHFEREKASLVWGCGAL